MYLLKFLGYKISGFKVSGGVNTPSYLPTVGRLGLNRTASTIDCTHKDKHGEKTVRPIFQSGHSFVFF